MGRRQTKQKYHLIVEFQRRVGELTDEQAERFKLMFSRCRTREETAQVAAALESFCNMTQGTDRYAVIMRDEDWFVDDDAVPCGC